MMEPLRAGKIRGLAATANEAGAFSILAFDHRQSFVRLLNASAGQRVDYSTVTAVKTQIVRVLSPHASAVLLDPVYGAAQSIASGALPGRSGLIVAVEETGYTGPDTARESSILAGWSVQKIKRMGADAVKLLIYYHPQAGKVAERQEALIQQIVEQCRRMDILLFLEIVTYSCNPAIPKNSLEFTSSLPNLIPMIASRLCGIGPDVLKLEFPLDVRAEPDEERWLEACQAVSAASTCPWTLLSAAADFETFSHQVEVACRAGASGFIAGRAVWQDALPMSVDERERWLREVGAARLDRLAAIAGRYARPWREFFPDLNTSIAEDWYLRYEG